MRQSVNMPWQKRQKNQPSSEFSASFEREVSLFLMVPELPVNTVEAEGSLDAENKLTPFCTQC